jgi:hypothetical protein
VVSVTDPHDRVLGGLDRTLMSDLLKIAQLFQAFKCKYSCLLYFLKKEIRENKYG